MKTVRLLTIGAVLSAVAKIPLAQAQRYTVLHSFTGGTIDGANPWAGVIRDSAGNLYGTTTGGGASAGVVYKLNMAGTETVLHSFMGPDGANPFGGVIRDSAGNLYGTTSYGGITTGVCAPYGCGVVFKLDPTGKETVLYSFTGLNGDGAYPNAGVIGDSARNLYGTTFNGGVTGGPCGTGSYGGCGVVFKLDPTGKETVLHSFTGLNGDGANPNAGLIRDSSGNLYGTTVNGSTSNRGVVLKLDPTGKETVLYSFTGLNGDGAHPYGGVIRDSSGNLYGTTSFGGITTGVCAPSSGCGVVFKVDPTGKETVLYSFTGLNGDGAYPNAGVIRDSSGNLYGTTKDGGITTGACFPFSCGVVFKLDPTGKETVLHSFTGGTTDGANPIAGVIRDSAGNLYGTTSIGGITTGVCAASSGCGVVFKLKP